MSRERIKDYTIHLEVEVRQLVAEARALASVDGGFLDDGVYKEALFALKDRLKTIRNIEEAIGAQIGIDLSSL